VIHYITFCKPQYINQIQLSIQSLSKAVSGAKRGVGRQRGADLRTSRRIAANQLLNLPEDELPFTPLHMAAVLIVKPSLDQRVSLIAFGLAQIAMDLERLLVIPCGT
jgi:hypothetical protein